MSNIDFDDLMKRAKEAKAPDDNVIAQSFRPIAVGVAEYYKGLMESGVEQGVALMLTQAFQEQALRVFGEMWGKQQKG